MRATDPAALRSVLSELEQAGRDHLDWYTDVVRGIVCGLPPDPDKLAPDADRRCRFGRWYHGHAPGELREHAACTALAAEHERVHCAATALLEGAAHAASDRIRAALAQATLAVAPDGDAVRITVSCGLASIDPDLEVAESIDRADRALMLAKAAGRNRVINWDPAIATGTMAPRLVEDRTAG